MEVAAEIVVPERSYEEVAENSVEEFETKEKPVVWPLELQQDLQLATEFKNIFIADVHS